MRSHRHRRRRSHKLLAAAIVIVALAAVAGGTDIAYASVKSRADNLQAALTNDLQAGQKELEAGKASLTQANARHDASLVPQATAHFAAAKEKFLAAANMADGSELLRGLALLPSIGDVVRSKRAAVSDIAAMGAAVSDAGQDLAGIDEQLIKPAVSGPAGRTLLTVLDQTRAGLVKVRADFERAQIAAAEVDINVVPAGQQAAFTKARDTIDTALAGLNEFDRLVPILVEVLGGNGPRTYLIEQVNPIELRAGGGFIGSYTMLRADHGTLQVIDSGDSYNLASARPYAGQPGFIPLPGPYREVIPWVSWSFVDSNLYPDFPSNARAAMNFVHPGGASLDAVISIDYYAVAKMLELTGPLTVPGYALIVDSANFVSLITRLDYASDPAHKAILAALAGPLMQRISALSPDRWPTLIAALNDLAAQRHLQAFFSNTAVEREIDRVGWSGALNLDTAADYMMEVESNYSGSKANNFLVRHYVVQLTRDNGVLHHRVTVELVNNTPYGSYVRTYYHADVRLFAVSAASRLANNLTPVRYPNPDPPSGTKVLEGWVLIQCCGDQARAVFEYDTPWPAQDKGKYRIYWQKQPGTLSDDLSINWNDGRGQAYNTTNQLTEDRVISLSSVGVTVAPAQLAQATLPNLSLG